MASLTLDRQHTALLIADFYAASWVPCRTLWTGRW